MMTMTADHPERVLDTTDSQLAEQLPAVRPNGAPLAPVGQPPTVESMIVTAIQHGTDPATLEKLVALAERVQDRNAAAAFNRAMAAFRSECPAIVKVRTASFPTKNGGQASYNYADLSEITKVVDPVLNRHGLTYHWDTDLNGELTIATCYVSHVDGHSRSSTFRCKGAGSPLMNSAQVNASAVTFARRYSLVLALGLTTDDDDDGRRAAPREQPDADPSQPRVGTRAEGYPQHPPASTVSPDVASGFTRVCDAWKRRNPNGTKTDFAAWAAKTLRTERDMGQLANWSVDVIAVLEEAL